MTPQLGPLPFFLLDFFDNGPFRPILFYSSLSLFLFTYSLGLSFNVEWLSRPSCESDFLT